MIVIIAGVFVIIVCIAVLFFMRKTWLKRSPDTAEQIRQWIDYEPRLADGRSYSPVPSRNPLPVSITVPAPKNINCLKGKTSITESLKALVEKYSLDEFTLITVDGLLLASSQDRIGAADAAKYSALFSRNRLEEMDGVIMFEIVHKDSSLIGVIRSEKCLPPEIEQKVKNNTKDILNWWI
jgi:hypothetical protein